MKYCVFDLDGTLTYTKPELDGVDLPSYITLTDSVYVSVLENRSEFERLMQEWRQDYKEGKDKATIAKQYNEKIIAIIPKEFQNDEAFYKAAYAATKNFIRLGVVIGPAIGCLNRLLEQENICIISTASFEPAAQGFIDALIDERLLPSHFNHKIKCCGTLVDWNSLTITRYNTGEMKLISLAECISSSPVDTFSHHLLMLVGDEPFAGDNALLSLNSLCFARQKRTMTDEEHNYPRLPNNCIWTTWESLLENIDDVASYHDIHLRKDCIDSNLASSSSSSSQCTMRFFPKMITGATMRHIMTLWNYHQLHHEIKTTADCIIGLGSYDLSVVDRCVELYNAKVAGKLLFSGKFGNWTKDLWEKTEAEIFARRAIELGVSEKDILIEKESTNIGENIKFSRAILEAQVITTDTVVIITKPNTERRAYATCKKVWPEVNLIVTSPQKRLEQLSPVQIENLAHEMVGDLQRIVHYPELGYQIPQDIPDDVMHAYNSLVELGYIGHMMKISGQATIPTSLTIPSIDLI